MAPAAAATVPAPASARFPEPAGFPEPAEEEELVVSDLAALLWEGLAEPHHDERV